MTCLHDLRFSAGSEPNSTGLPAGYEYLCSVEEAEPAFDESLHLSVSVLAAGISADSTPGKPCQCNRLMQWAHSSSNIVE